MDQKLFQRFCTLYESQLRLLRNPVCGSCDAAIKNPLAIWHVGHAFMKSRIRVLFVGKPHRGKPGIIRPSGLIDPREKVEKLKDESWAYWSYTREIATLLFGDRDMGWNSIALTNLVKCTNVAHGKSSVDMTTERMVRSCAIELGVLSAEIKMLRPTHMVFYTGNLFPELIDNLEIEGSLNWQNISKKNIHCGEKKLFWWHRKIQTSWGKMRALITGHPERMLKDAYTRLVAGWIRASLRN